ncbi:MAG: TlpA family protein disulfide reductase [Myxococcota bacterium]
MLVVPGGVAFASGGKPTASPESISAEASASGSAGEVSRVSKPTGQFGRQLIVLDQPMPVPDYIFEEQVADGSTRDLAILDFRGRVVVLNFWATWCGVCAKELPKLDALAGKLAESGIDIVALSLDEEMKVAAGTLKKRGHGTLRIFRDSQSVLSALLGVRGVPTTFVVRPNGDAVAMVQGPADWSSPEALAWLRSLAQAEAQNVPPASIPDLREGRVAARD